MVAIVLLKAITPSGLQFGNRRLTESTCGSLLPSFFVYRFYVKATKHKTNQRKSFQLNNTIQC